MDEESKEIERQRLELEREKLDFERRKFEVETQNNSIEKTPVDKKTTIRDIIGYICSIILIISTFLPWLSSSSKGGPFSFSASINGLSTGHGFIIILCAMAAITLIYLKQKWVLIPIGIALLDSITVMAGVGSVSASSGKYSAKAGFAIGPVIVAITSTAMIISTLLKNKSSGSKFDLKSFFIQNKFKILLGIFLFFLFIPILFGDYNTAYLFPPIILGVAIPGFILFYLKLKKSFMAFMPLALFYILGYILSYYKYRHGYSYNPYDSDSTTTIFMGMAFSTNAIWFNFLYYLTLIIILVEEVWARKGMSLIPEPYTKFLNYIKPKTYYPILFVPFVLLAFYNMTTKHITSEEESKIFYEKLRKIEGDWYFVDKDTSEVYQLQINGSIENNNLTEEEWVEAFEVRDNFSGELSYYFSYRIFTQKEKFNHGNFDYISQFDDIISFPYLVNDSLIIQKVDDEYLEIKTIITGNNQQTYRCVKDIEKIQRLLDQKIDRDLAIEEEKRLIEEEKRGVQCQESEEEEYGEGMDAYYVQTKTCKYRYIEIIDEKTNDDADCKFTCHNISYYLTENGTAKRVRLIDYFVDYTELLSRLNKDFENDFATLNEYNPDCFFDISFQLLSFEEISLTIDDTGFNFYAPSGVDASCEGPAGILSSFISLEEIKPFLR